MVDLGELFLIAGVSFLIATDLALLAAFRYANRRLTNIRSEISAFVNGFLWEEVQEEKDGKPITIRKPSPQLIATIDAAIPALMPHVMAKVRESLSTLKLKTPDGKEVGALDPANLLGFVPKKYQGLAQLFLPQIQGMLGKFLGGASGPSAGGGGSLEANPFMKQLGGK